MKESGQEELPEQASALNNLYASAQTEALESGKPLVEQSSTLQGQNVTGDVTRERMSGSGLEQKLDKLLQAQEQKAARRAAKKLPKAAAEGAKKLVSFLK
jgi:hypothetical protein